MSADDLWKKLLTRENLKRGGHLARLDIKQGFSEDLYSTDVSGTDLDNQITEMVNRLNTDTYQPRTLLNILKYIFTRAEALLS